MRDKVDKGGEDMVEVVELLKRVLEELREVREALRRIERRWEVRSGGQQSGLSLRDLTEGELRIAYAFLNWLRKGEESFGQLFDSGGEEGYDRVAKLCYLRKGTMEDCFINFMVRKGYLRRDVLRVLGDLGLLRYRVKSDGARQYCIRASWRHGRIRKEGSRYVINWARVEELIKEMEELIKEMEELIKERSGGGNGAGVEKSE